RAGRGQPTTLGERLDRASSGGQEEKRSLATHGRRAGCGQSSGAAPRRVLATALRRIGNIITGAGTFAKHGRVFLPRSCAACTRPRKKASMCFNPLRRHDPAVGRVFILAPSPQTQEILFMTTTNGTAEKKSLQSQLDRFDRILDGLADGLNEAVAAA